MLYRLAVCLSVLMGVFPMSTAQTTDVLKSKVTLHLQNADLHAVLQAVMQQTGAQFVFVTSDEEFAPVTVRLVDQPLETAVKYICMSAKASYRVEPGGVFVISHLGSVLPPDENTRATQAAVPEPVAPREVAKAPEITTKIFLNSAHPKDVINALFMRDREVYENSVAMLQFMLNGKREWPRPGLQTTLLYAGDPVRSYPLGEDVVTPEGGTVPTGANRSGGVNVFGAQIGRGGGIGPTGGGGQIGGPGGVGPGGVGGQTGTGQGQLPSESLIPDGIRMISYDPTDNSIVVKGTEEAIDELKRYVTMFDVRPQQVMVKVEFVTVLTNRSDSFGIDWLYQRVNFSMGNTPGTFAVTGDPIFVNFSSGNVVSRLRARLLSGEGKVVNAPLITTLNNQPATIQSVLYIWVPRVQTIGFGGGQVQTQTIPEQVTVPSFLSVAPRVNRDGTITISVAPQISELGQVRKFPDGGEYPDQTEQSALVTRIIKSGETMVLGGLTRKQNTTSYLRYPILGDLPILGQFFRTKSRTIEESELLIFITPSVIPDEDSPGMGFGP